MRRKNRVFILPYLLAGGIGIFALLITSIAVNSSGLLHPALEVHLPYERTSYSAGEILVLHVKPVNLGPISKLRAYSPGKIPSIAQDQGSYYRVIVELPSDVEGSLDIPVRAVLDDGTIVEKRVNLLINT